MKTQLILTFACAAGILLLTGCVPASDAADSATRTVVTGHEGGAYVPVNTDRYDLENHTKFVTLDHAVQRSVTYAGLYETRTPEGRLQVTANIRNRLSRRIQVQVNCVFKDALGAPTGDETPFETLILNENAQEGVKFTAMNNLATTYTIRVREAR